MIKTFFINKRFLFLAIALVLMSCNMKVYTLLDKIIDVPKNAEAYKNKLKFKATILNIIDTAVVYEEFDNEKKILKRLDQCTACRGYTIYKFYPNGCFNMFYFSRNSTLPTMEFDPQHTGYRGVYYTENGKIKYDLYAEIDDRQHTGKITGTLTISGDTLYVKRDNRKGIDATSYPARIYIKRQLPPEYFVYQANW